MIGDINHNGNCCPTCRTAHMECHVKIEEIHQMVDKHIIDETREMAGIHGDLRLVTRELSDLESSVGTVQKIGWGILLAFSGGLALAVLNFILSHITK